MATQTQPQKKVKTPKGRISFPSVFVKSGMQGAEPKYRCTIIFDETTDLTELKELAARAAREKWGDKLPTGFRSPFRKGTSRQREDKSFPDGFSEKTVDITATSTRRPVVGDVNRDEITAESDEFYGGCFGKLIVTAFAYDKGGNKGVSFGLLGAQKLEDGPAFGGARASLEDFDGPAAPAAGAKDPLFDM